MTTTSGRACELVREPTDADEAGRVVRVPVRARPPSVDGGGGGAPQRILDRDLLGLHDTGATHCGAGGPPGGSRRGDRGRHQKASTSTRVSENVGALPRSAKRNGFTALTVC